MGFSSSIDFRFASSTKDPLAVIQHLLKNGWTFNDSDSVWFLPLNDNNRFDWQREPLDTWPNVVKIIEEKTRAKQIIGQMSKRGWTEESIKMTTSTPFAKRIAQNKASGNSATAFFNEDGSYVIVDDVTGDVIQISDINDPNWIPDFTIQDPYFPN